MASTTSEVVWITGLLKELGLGSSKPVDLYCDNKAAIQIAVNPIFHERTKHIEIDCHFIREKIQRGLLCIKYVKSSEQLADIFTKKLGVGQHEYLISKLSLIDIYQPQLEEECK